MNSQFVIAMTLLGFLLVCSVHAQEPGKAQVDEPAAVVTEEVVDADAAEEPEGDDDNFIPTEKINVDSSVSFPVDI